MYIFWTDTKVKLDNGKFLQLSIRSSLAKRGLQLTNAPGIVDEDYYGNPNNDGNIGFMVKNNDMYDRAIKKGDRIAQGIILDYHITEDDLASGKRKGGYGSTGK